MYIGYVNFILNAKESKEKTNVYSLKNAYTYLDTLSFPITQGNLTINKIEVCSNSRGCSIKTPHSQTNYLVRLKDESTNGKSYTNVHDGKYVLINMRGVYKLGSHELTVFLRVPRSGVIGVRVGLSKQDSIKITNNNSSLTTLGKSLEKDIFKMFNGKINKTRPFSLANMAIFGLNVFNPTTGNRPPQRIDDFADFVELLEMNLESHTTYYSPSNGKAVVRANFKPKSKNGVSFGITQWGMVDMTGVKSLNSARNLKKDLLKAFDSIKGSIEFNNETPPPKSSKQTGCTTRNPSPPCNPSYIPLPNKKKQICCYKKKMTDKKIKEQYAKFGVNIPQSLMTSLNLSKPINKIELPYYNSKSRKIMYKKKPFRSEKCNTLSKPELMEMAKAIGANPGKFKKDICSSIFSKLSQNAQKKRKSIRKKFVLFSNKMLS
jgi:hypothetical protein